MPLLESPFTSALFGNNGHLQTIIPALFRKQVVTYNRMRMITADHDFLDIDTMPTNSKKLMLLLHGLEGSSNSQYIKGFANYFKAKNWNIAALNFRSCSGEMNAKLISYHSGKTDDVHAALQYLINSYYFDEVFIVGFSLGGNVALKWAADYSAQIPKQIKGVAAISAPVDLADSAKQMAKLSNTIYMKRFLKSLHAKMILKDQQFPGNLNVKSIPQIKTFHQFDNQFTGPIHGFKDAADYYQQSSSLNHFHKITIPSLLLNAKNDPFLGDKCYPFEIVKAHTKIFGEFPEIGGHVGFAEGLPNNSYYSEQCVERFILQQI